jgi:hypothetical protein
MVDPIYDHGDHGYPYDATNEISTAWKNGDSLILSLPSSGSLPARSSTSLLISSIPVDHNMINKVLVYSFLPLIKERRPSYIN